MQRKSGGRQVPAHSSGPHRPDRSLGPLPPCRRNAGALPDIPEGTGAVSEMSCRGGASSEFLPLARGARRSSLPTAPLQTGERGSKGVADQPERIDGKQWPSGGAVRHAERCSDKQDHIRMHPRPQETAGSLPGDDGWAEQGGGPCFGRAREQVRNAQTEIRSRDCRVVPGGFSMGLTWDGGRQSCRWPRKKGNGKAGPKAPRMAGRKRRRGCLKPRRSRARRRPGPHSCRAAVRRFRCPA